MRSAIALMATAAVLVLAGCVGDTDPASEVRATQARLNAHGHTNNGPASWWWEYGVARATVAGGGGTRTPKQGPASSPNDVSLGTVVRNLEPDQSYFFRACGQDAAAGSAVNCGRIRELLTAPGDSTVSLNRTFHVLRFDGAGQTRHVLGVLATSNPAELLITDTVPVPQTDPPKGSALTAGEGCASLSQGALGLMTVARCTDSAGISGVLAFLGPLDDQVSLSLPAVAGEFHGGGGADSLTGGPRNDALYGDAGNDHLNGGQGADRLVGGPGLDVFDCDSDDEVITDSTAEENQVKAAGC